MKADEAWTSDEIRTLRDRLLDICSDHEETVVVTLALFQAWLVVLTCGAPTPQAAKDVLKATLERAESDIDAAWAKYRARDTN